jgi:hypothetical protein
VRAKVSKNILIIVMILLLGGVGYAKTSWVPRTGFQQNMIVFGTIEATDFNFKSGKAYIYGFGPRGEGDCRSVSQITEDGAYYMTVAGDKGDEPITFVGVDAEDRVYPFTDKLIFHSDETVKDLIIH